MKKTIYFFAKRSITTFLFIFIISGNLNSQDLNPANWPSLVGYWQFQDTTDLTHATVGNDLILIGQHQYLAGPSYGDTAVRIDTGNYYKVYHGITANGGGDSVNQYTLMFDFRVLNFDRWHCFQQTDSTNQNDADCFIKPYPDSLPGMIGVGYTGYSAMSINPNDWYRLMISVNLGNFYNYYLNGVLIHTGDTSEIQIDDRFALTEAILFFADNNQEDDTIDIASIAIFDTCLSPSQIAQIGTLDPCVANPPIVELGLDTFLCSFDSLLLSAGSDYVSYVWSTGDTVESIYAGCNSVGISPYPDTFWVNVMDVNGCEAADTVLIQWVICGSIEEYHQPQVQIYPNPSNGHVDLKLTQTATKIYVYDIKGKKVKEFAQLQAGIHHLNFEDLSEGVYIIEIQTREIKLHHKIIINK